MRWSSLDPHRCPLCSSLFSSALRGTAAGTMPAPTAVVKNCDMPEDMMKGAPPPATLCAVCCALAERMWVAWMCAEAIEFAMEAQVTYNTDKEVAQAVRNRFVKKVCCGAGRSNPVCCAPGCRAVTSTAHTTACALARKLPLRAALTRVAPSCDPIAVQWCVALCSWLKLRRVHNVRGEALLLLLCGPAGSFALQDRLDRVGASYEARLRSPVHPSPSLAVSHHGP